MGTILIHKDIEHRVHTHMGYGEYVETEYFYKGQEINRGSLTPLGRGTLGGLDAFYRNLKK